MNKVIDKIGSYFVIPPKENAREIKANVIDWGTPRNSDIPYRETPPLTPAMVREIEQNNAMNAKRPVTKLGKKGNTFTEARIEYKILERTEQYMFLEAKPLVYNPGQKIVKVDDKGKKVYGRTYWVVGTVSVYASPRLDGFDMPTTEIGERQEHVRCNPDLEARMDDKGMVKLAEATNYQFDKVQAQYLGIVAQHEAGIQLAKVQTKANKTEAIITSKRTAKLTDCQTAKYKAVGELKQLLIDCKSIDSIMKDKVARQLVNDITTYDVITKYLS